MPNDRPFLIGFAKEAKKYLRPQRGGSQTLPPPPRDPVAHKAKLLSELDKTSSLIRDLLNKSFSRIVVNDKDMHDSISHYLEANMPEKSVILQYYK